MKKIKEAARNKEPTLKEQILLLDNHIKECRRKEFIERIRKQSFYGRSMKAS